MLSLISLFVCLQTIINAQNYNDYSQTSIEEVIKKGIDPLNVGDLRIDAIKEKTFLHHLGKFKRLNYFQISNCDTLPTGIFELKFVKTIRIKKGINHFPNGAYEKLQYLTQIDIEQMKDKKGGLSSLPDGFSKLPTLKKFHAPNNNFTQFPMVLTKIISLEMIQMTDNKISSIPEEIMGLKFLQGLILDNNPIKSLPKELGFLKNLKTLFVDDTLITTIPIELSQIQGLAIIVVPNSVINVDSFKKKCINNKIVIMQSK